MKNHWNNLTTLCYIETKDSYLMLHRTKKKQDVNQDKWIGVGGHFEAGESPEECLLREVKEETGFTLTSFQFRGIVTFTYQKPGIALDDWKRDGRWICQDAVQADMEYMCLYTADAYKGVMTDCAEGELVWIPKKEVLSLPIWEGDRIFLHLLAEKHPFFSLKLDYIGEHLERAVLDGIELELTDGCWKMTKEVGSHAGI